MKHADVRDSLDHDERLAEIPIHTTVRIRHDGTGTVRHLAFCPRRESCVDLDVCATCEHATDLPTRPEHGDAQVRCRKPTEVASGRNRAPWNVAVVGAWMRRKAVSVELEASLDSVVRCLVELDSDAVTVVDDAQKLIGIITKSDVLRRIYEDGSVPDNLDAPLLERGLHIQAPLEIMNASDLMTIAVHALPEDAPISTAIRLFATLDVEQLPVVDERGRLSGMFSRSDVVRWLSTELGYCAA